MTVPLRHRSCSTIASLLVLSSLSSLASAERLPYDTPPTEPADGSEIIHRYYQAAFAPAPVSSENGCVVLKSETLCRENRKPVQAFDTRIVASSGPPTAIEKIELVEGCVSLHVRLAVDHLDPEGHQCSAVLSVLFVDITLH
ncbi:hypothetical protein [Burkholderia cenocepacia]|uniref:hypothetical protein n=1 Tax=Burkholderia cenocepacia TaxID=95486 RepID=UPI00123738B7|nr:hypothetical protein [Burkholderia cenocepacia]